MTDGKRVPLVDLRAQYDGLRDDILARIADVLDGMQLFLGPNVQALEAEFAAYCGTRFAVATSSGTSALQLALRAAGVGPGDEVVTVAHTFIATAGAIIQAGATPVFVDVDPETYLIDANRIEAAITPRTQAIVPVHLYGRLCDMEAIEDVARRHGLAVVEDACQAHGARRDGRAAGAWGRAGCFSFYFSKNLGAYGETGIITTDDAELDETIRQLRDHGSASKYQHAIFGDNARPDEIQAAILRAKLPHLDRWNAARQQHAAAYRRALAGAAQVRCAAEAPAGEHVYHQFVVEVVDRDAVRQRLLDRGVESGIHYPVPIHRQEAWRRYSDVAYSLPRTEQAAERILSLPMYPELTDEQLSRVTEALIDCTAEALTRGRT